MVAVSKILSPIKVDDTKFNWAAGVVEFGATAVLEKIQDLDTIKVRANKDAKSYNEACVSTLQTTRKAYTDDSRQAFTGRLKAISEKIVCIHQGRKIFAPK